MTLLSTNTNIDWLKLIDYKYWFQGFINTTGSLFVTPAVQKDSIFYWSFLIAFSLIIISGIILKVLQLFLHKNHPLQFRIPFLSDNLIWIGIVGISWFVLRQIEVAFLGMRIWIIPMGIWLTAILGISIKYMFNFYKLELSYFKKTRESLISKPVE